MPKPIPDPEKVKNFPKNCGKIVLVRDRENIRVVKRNYYWDTEKKRGLETREYLGYVVDDVYYPTQEYKRLFKKNGKPRLMPRTIDGLGIEAAEGSGLTQSNYKSLDTYWAGEIPLYLAIADRMDLTKDLISIWGLPAAKAILALACHWLNTDSNATYLFESWAHKRFLPIAEPINSKEISQFFANLANTPGWRQQLFESRLNWLPEDEVLSFDATEIATEAEEISYAEWGKGKEGGFQRQVGLILLLGHRSGLPVLFRILPGQISDVSTVPDMLFRFNEITNHKKRVFAAVLDRGYCSLRNIQKFIETGSRVVMAAKTNLSWVREAMDEAIPHLQGNANRMRGHSCWGYTIRKCLSFEDNKKADVWVHVYRSHKKANVEMERFYDQLNDFEKDWMNWDPEAQTPDGKPKECPLLKSPLLKYYRNIGNPGIARLRQNDEAIDRATKYFGLFCNVTTMDCDALDALESYCSRDLIEKAFKSGKSDLGMDVVRSHYDDTMEGRFIVSFVALSILTRLRWYMKLPSDWVDDSGKRMTFPPLADKMSFNELKNRLHTIHITLDSNGKTRWDEVTERQHEIAGRLGFSWLYKISPSFTVPLYGIAS